MQTTKLGPSAPGARPGRPDPGPDVAREAARGSRIVYYLVATLLSALAAAALVTFSPEIAIGAIVACVFGVMVLARPFWGLLLYTCLFLIRPAELYPALAPLHLERAVGALALIGMFLAQYQREGRLLLDRSRQTGLLLVFLAAVVLSVPFAYWRAQAVTGFIEMLKLVALYLLIVHLVDSRRRLRVYVGLLSILTVYIAAVAFRDYLQGSSFFAQGIDRAVGETSIANNPNQLGTTLATAVPLFLVLALCRPLRGWRVFFGLATLLSVITMAVTGSRASLLGFLAGMVCLWWTSRRRVLVGLVGLALLVAGFLVLPAQYKTRYSTLTSEQLDASSQGRTEAWIAGLRMAIDRPVFGVGIRCFGTAHAGGYSPDGHRNWLESHSLYIQVLAELGLVGAIVFLLLFWEFLRLTRRVAGLLVADDRWRFESALLKAVFAGFVVLLVSGIFGHSLFRYTWYVYAGLSLCVLRIYQKDPTTTPPAAANP
ncbi:MAG: O-Antigen ligase [Bacteroidetes bacterium]|nr:O-Antigen ligase [Bacteroidota bacterium]